MTDREIKFRAWNGDKSIGYTMNGYQYRKAPQHPFATGRGYVLEHRLVMENHMGGYLPKGAVIHHKNGIRDDNRIENLEYIPEQSRHAKSHDTGSRNANGQFVAQCDEFSRIKFRLYNKDVRQTQVMTLAKLIATTFRRSKFEYRGVFTGLKDRNGKEIWEGDVVSVANAVELPDGRFEDAIHTVTFVEGGFRLPDHSAPDIKIAHDLGETVELEKVFVIGNIYENPELLEQSE